MEPVELTPSAPAPGPPRNVPCPKPLFPDLLIPEGIESPVEFEIRKDSVSGARVRAVDIDRDNPGALPPGNYVLVVRWPAGEVVPGTNRRGGYFSGGKVFFDVPEPAPPAAPSAPTPPALPPEMVDLLGRLGRSLEAMDARLSKLEQGGNGNGGMSGLLDRELMSTLLKRALEPPSAADPVEQMQKLAGMAETFARWGKHGGPAAAEREPSGGEVFAGALDTIGKHVNAAFTAAKGDASQAGALLAAVKPKDLAERLKGLAVEQLGEWMADAIEQEVLPSELLEEGAADVVASALKLGPESAQKLCAALKLAAASFEPEAG